MTRLSHAARRMQSAVLKASLAALVLTAVALHVPTGADAASWTDSHGRNASWTDSQRPSASWTDGRAPSASWTDRAPRTRA